MALLHKYFGNIVTHTLAAALLLGLGTAHATPLTLELVKRSESFDSNIAIDQATGRIYEMDGYGPGPYFGRPGPYSVRVYADYTAFEKGHQPRIVMSDANLWGTYFAVNNGFIFGRTSAESFPTWPADAQTSKISLDSGSTVVSKVTAGMGGTNGIDTFDWGGFSGANVLQGGNGIYVMGGMADHTNWRIASYDYNLNLQGVTDVVRPLATTGFAFVIGDVIYIGDSYSAPHISQVVNMKTGRASLVDFTLTVPGVQYQAYNYISSTAYNSFTDTLYIKNSGLGFEGMYKLANASAAFSNSHLPDNEVPEPSTLASLSIALVSLVAAYRARTVKRHLS